MSRTAKVWLATIGILAGMAAAPAVVWLIASRWPIVAPISAVVPVGFVVIALVCAVADRYID